MSKFYYCRLFKEETDTTINNYLNEVRCHYAYELLSESNLRVGEVAKACGYNSTSPILPKYLSIYLAILLHMWRKLSSSPYLKSS
ncbi:helix-turn-helix transcriptional regulator [Erysipelothrix piscisicarius]|uniref:helix-turn-helix transcriptional regulator n=1 Tax=Erysipelothrix piscisicarius TaxID=2485784 RepID=UPI002F927FD7